MSVAILTHNCDALPDEPLQVMGAAGNALLMLGIGDYRNAAAYVRDLPYGRNVNRSDPLCVIRDGKGTCSTKHAFLKALADEERLPVRLMLAIYEMNPLNTPGIGEVLQKSGLACIPEAHCYLSHNGIRIDLSRNLDRTKYEPISSLLVEEEISPGQIGEYKRRWHQGFMRQWLDERPSLGISFEQLWRVREECISALSGAR